MKRKKRKIKKGGEDMSEVRRSDVGDVKFWCFMICIYALFIFGTLIDISAKQSKLLKINQVCQICEHEKHQRHLEK